MTRTLLCPVCGATLECPTDEQGSMPCDYLLPRHVPRGPNLCAAYRVPCHPAESTDGPTDLAAGWQI